MNFVFQVLVGGGNDANIDGQVVAGADRREALLLDHAQHFGLRAQAHVAHFVEEQRAAMGLFELARLVLQRAGKGSFDVPEKLAFDELFRNGGAVDFYKRLLGALAVIVQRVGHQFLSRAAFAVDEHAAIGGGGELQLLAQSLHGDAVADDAVAAVQLRAQLAVLRGQLRLLQRVAKRQQGLVNGKRLLNEIEGAELGGADGRFNGAMPGNHDDRGRRFQGLDFFQHLNAVHARQPDVEQDDVKLAGLESFQASFAAADGFHTIAFVLEDIGEGFADAGFVINNED